MNEAPCTGIHWWNSTQLCPPPGWDNLWVPLFCVGGVLLAFSLVWVIIRWKTGRWLP